MSAKESVESQEKQSVSQLEETDKMKDNVDIEKEKLKRGVVEIKKRLDRANAQLKKAELEATEMQNVHFAEKERWTAEISYHQHQSEKLSKELNDYKAKAHLLMKTRDQELNALKAELQHRSDLEIDLRVLREKFDDLSAERDQLKEELTQANEQFQVHLDGLVVNFQQKIDAKTSEVEKVQSENEALQKSICKWKEKFDQLEKELLQKTEALESLTESANLMKKELEGQKLEKYEVLEKELTTTREEFSAYKKTMEQMSEVQQLEISRLIQSNLELRKQLTEDDGTFSRRFSFDQQSSLKDVSFRHDEFQLSDLLQTDREHISKPEIDESVSESQIVALASRQAEREETLHALKRENKQLLSEMEDLEKELELHRQQELVLKAALREADQIKQQLKSDPPKNMDFQYLRNTVIKLFTTGEYEALLPVLSKLLHFSDDENRSIEKSIRDRKKSSEASENTLLALTEWSWIFEVDILVKYRICGDLRNCKLNRECTASHV